MTNDRKITLKEIARQVGVSPSLVSCILNGRQRASEEVQAKVTALLEQAGYRPKYARKPFLFVMDFPEREANNEYLGEEQAGIQSLLNEEGCSLLVEFLPNQASSTLSERAIEGMLRRTAARNPGGVFVPCTSDWLSIAASVFNEARIPLVQVGFDVESPSYHGVVVDSFSGAYQAVRYMAQMGHTRIATIRWNARGIYNSNRKHAGFLAGLADAKISAPPEYIRNIDKYPHDADWTLPRRVLEDMLELPEPPTAVFIENIAISTSLLYPVPGDGGQIPEAVRNVMQVHFEDISLDYLEGVIARELGYPPRDTHMVAIDWYALGRTAARVMINIASNPAPLQPQILRVSPVLQRIQGRKRTLITTHFQRV